MRKNAHTMEGMGVFALMGRGVNSFRLHLGGVRFGEER